MTHKRDEKRVKAGVVVATHISSELTRREALRLVAAGVVSLGAGAIRSHAVFAAPVAAVKTIPVGVGPYAELLRTWCDGLLAHQVTGIADAALRGGLLCPACGLIHGRCGDAVYPLLREARTTGEAKYVRAAELVHDWSERQVSRPDGSWVNDLTLSTWQGITVFHAIALAEALHHHGSLLDTKTRAQWMERLARAAKFLDGFITIETGNINYPVTASYCFALCGQVLGEPRYGERGRVLAHAGIEHFTANHFLAGEGHPLDGVSRKGCRPVDLGYNVEESLPALALYSQLTGDETVRDATVAALKTHMEFMLPDGAWDNSWGTRNYKWSWWGSRTSDGCQPAFVLMAEHDERFAEVARRNLALMAACTHDGLLYGGPDYLAHGDLPCIHHTFTHAKALATVLDRGSKVSADALNPAGAVEVRPMLLRDAAYGLKHFDEIGTWLASVGPWRATVTDYDWEYVEQVQSGGGKGGGGHATGGAMSLLYHQTLGPVLTASMTEYQMIEISNQQTFRSGPHMALTPRIECRTGSGAAQAFTSLSDLEAVVKASEAGAAVELDASGRLQTAGHEPMAGAGGTYRLRYRISEKAVEVSAQADGTGGALRFIMPVIARSDERVTAVNAVSVRVAKAKGSLLVTADTAFGAIPEERTFNLVPGFECVPLEIAMEPGKEVRVRIEALGA